MRRTVAIYCVLATALPGLSACGNADESSGPSAGMPKKSVGLTLDTATPDQFYDDGNFTDEQRIEWASQQLDSPSQDAEYPNMTVEQAAYSRLNVNLAAKNRLPLETLTGSPLVARSKDNSANEVNTQRTVVSAAAAYEPNIEKATKILAGAFDNSVLENPNNLVISTLNANHKLPESDRLKVDAQVTFTPADANVLQGTGQVVELSTPINNLTPPSRTVYETDAQDGSHRPDFEERQSFINDRWIETGIISQSEASWITPGQLRNTQSE